MTSSPRFFLSATVSLLVLSCAAFAQSQLASLSGRVTNPSGGVVAGAAVELKNIDTGEHFRAVANSSGAYMLPIVKPGKYEFQAEASGFKRYQRTGLVLETGLQARLDRLPGWQPAASRRVRYVEGGRLPTGRRLPACPTSRQAAN